MEEMISPILASTSMKDTLHDTEEEDRNTLIDGEHIYPQQPARTKRR